MWFFLGLPLGALFGFLLSRAGATTYDYYAKLFLFEDLQLVWVIGTALMLGVGWGLAAACPGTVLAMIGEGKLSALFTVLGIVLGTYAYGLWHDAKRVPP